MRRRAVWLVLVAAAAVVVGGALHLSSDTTRSAHRRTTTSQREDEVGEQNGGVAYGDTQHTVFTKLGDPSKKRDGCWFYTLHDHAIDGMNLGKNFDAIKYCFADGPAGGTVVSTIYVHLIPSAVARLPEDKRPSGGWMHPFTVMSKASEHVRF